MQPYRAEGAFDWQAVLHLIQTEFAYMEGRIDPPSSMHRLQAGDLAAADQVWVIGAPVVACVVLTVKGDALYIGKLAVAAQARGKGHARALIDVAEGVARVRGLAVLELETRVELVENQAVFLAMGFQEVGRKAHAGFARPTSITYRRAV